MLRFVPLPSIMCAVDNPPTSLITPFNELTHARRISARPREVLHLSRSLIAIMLSSSLTLAL